MTTKRNINPNENGEKTMTEEIRKFQVDRIYENSSVCDSECIFSFRINRRTEKSVWITGSNNINNERRKIDVYNGEETIYPFGKYSMATIIGADDIKKDEIKTKDEKIDIKVKINKEMYSNQYKQIQIDISTLCRKIENGCTLEELQNLYMPQLDRLTLTRDTIQENLNLYGDLEPVKPLPKVIRTAELPGFKVINGGRN